ncbi:uncharacterized protein LOC141719309 [Apium graveolens]|uniref:uncharacterized protein LOC141719309 n=1 Tax=Apium graveolens TaxID=4045 RepID=UPI003D79FBA8
MEATLKTKTQCHQKNRTKREIKVGPAFRSPYIQRNIDINSSYSRQEIAVYRWMIDENMDDTAKVFVSGDYTCFAEVLKTLKLKEKLSCVVIDIWSILMNARENYKSTESPMRLYMDIGLSIALLDETKTREAQYELFKNDMKHYFERYPSIRIENADLIFFPGACI